MFNDESGFCLQHHDGRRHIGKWLLNCCVMHRYTGPSTGIMVWGGIGFHCRKPVVYIGGTQNSQRYISAVLEHVVVLLYIKHVLSVIFQQDNARRHLFKRFSLFIGLNCFLNLILLPIYRQSKMNGPCLHIDWTGIQ
ncbi:transposable element Tc3 transposase [Trichonephila clavipes]|nr:transposable element Tc3 transposase [Trichonephila clavipes]